ncbi:MAG: Holliday junction branch migration protein RuvA [Acholeplasmatales bacterium]|jgi:Holliday junction DNA helicase RuvA|nr:Holliday junction branch migration protein RuvA [Acholeplasmatales bacterium]
MYSYIKGVVKEINHNSITLENNQIGYLIIVPNPFSYKIDELVLVYTYLYVKEDRFDLFGFSSIEGRKLFLLLLSVNGIGPKSALSILAYDNIDKINKGINDKDVKFLTKFPGIGTKSAEQIILDLKGKIITSNSFENTHSKEDAISALIALGYKEKDALNMLKNIDDSLSVDSMIKLALRKLN